MIKTMENIEMEFKYDASKIDLSTFKKFCSVPGFKYYEEAAGADHFYSGQSSASFFRLREGPIYKELTFKVKLEKDNNFTRIEHNIKLDLVTTSEHQVASFLKDLGYSKDTTIHKYSVVYGYDYYLMAYYVVYDDNRKELGRFIEIEMLEGYDWKSSKEAWSELVLVEKLCKPLGLKPENRIKESLFELYRKK